MTYIELQDALQVLGLRERCSLGEIKTHHRELVKRYHPDTGKVGDNEMIQKVNAAYKTVQNYITMYRFSFNEDEFYQQNPEEHLRRQFMDVPMWGKR